MCIKFTVVPYRTSIIKPAKIASKKYSKRKIPEMAKIIISHGGKKNAPIKSMRLIVVLLCII